MIFLDLVYTSTCLWWIISLTRCCTLPLSNDNSYADHIKCSHGPHLARGPLVTHSCCRRNISLLIKCLPDTVTNTWCWFSTKMCGINWFSLSPSETALQLPSTTTNFPDLVLPFPHMTFTGLLINTTHSPSSCQTKLLSFFINNDPLHVSYFAMFQFVFRLFKNIFQAGVAILVVISNSKIIINQRMFSSKSRLEKLLYCLNFELAGNIHKNTTLAQSSELWMLALQNKKMNVGRRSINEKQPDFYHLDTREDKWLS